MFGYRYGFDFYGVAHHTAVARTAAWNALSVTDQQSYHDVIETTDLAKAAVVVDEHRVIDVVDGDFYPDTSTYWDGVAVGSGQVDTINSSRQQLLMNEREYHGEGDSPLVPVNHTYSAVRYEWRQRPLGGGAEVVLGETTSPEFPFDVTRFDHDTEIICVVYDGEFVVESWPVPVQVLWLEQTLEDGSAWVYDDVSFSVRYAGGDGRDPVYSWGVDGEAAGEDRSEFQISRAEFRSDGLPHTVSASVEVGGVAVAVDSTLQVRAPETGHLQSILQRLPTGSAWRSQLLRQIVRGIGAELQQLKLSIEGLGGERSWLYGDRLSEWEAVYGLEPLGQISDREARVKAAYLASSQELYDSKGSLSLKGIEHVLQLNGFDLNLYYCTGLNTTSAPRAVATQYGTARYGASQLSGGVSVLDPRGYRAEELLVDSIDPSGEIVTFEDVGADRRAWRFLYYVGGSTFDSRGSVPAHRRQELRRLLLQLVPMEMWGVLMVDYM